MSPYIIAEIGSNYETLDDCIYSIKAAKNAGANAAKFQLYSHKELYGYPGPSLPGELSREWVPILKRACDKANIEFMCTAFSSDGLRFLNEFVERHKIASSCVTDSSMLRTLAGFNKPVYLSTGASSLSEIARAMDLIGKKVTPLYCVASYPAKVIELEKIPLMRKMLNVDVGYSDHSCDALIVPRMAAQYGAVCIEKHFQAVPGEFPDSGHSINERQFAMMVDAIQGRPSVPSISWTAEEQDMVKRHRSRVVAMKDLSCGDTLQRGVNYGVFRAKEDDLVGLNGFAADRIHGLKINKAINRGCGIGPQDI